MTPAVFAGLVSITALGHAGDGQTDVLASGGTTSTTNRVQTETPVNPLIDYAGFVTLTSDLTKTRQAHRVAVEKFVEMAKDPATIILDTRSKKAFDEIHVAGARHLNFSDFTEQKLAQVIPSRKTRILIYCNNNFQAPGPDALNLKSPRLALNIPTFVNLHGYGYRNVYELADALRVDDSRVRLVSTAEERAEKQLSKGARTVPAQTSRGFGAIR